MKPHPRIRRFFKWGGTVLSALLCTVWIGSVFVECWYTHRGRHQLFLDSGVVSYWHNTPGNYTNTSEVRWRRMIAPRLIWSSQRIPTAVGWSFSLPLWPFVLASVGSTAAAWRMDTLAQRRKRLGVCTACGYDRAGLAAGAPCPECNAKA